MIKNYMYNKTDLKKDDPSITDESSNESSRVDD